MYTTAVTLADASQRTGFLERKPISHSSAIDAAEPIQVQVGGEGTFKRQKSHERHALSEVVLV